MTDRELLQQAMECLLAWEEESSGYGWSKLDQETVDAIRTRLAQPEPEPVELQTDEIYDAAFSAYCRGETSRELFRLMWNMRLTCSIGWDRNELTSFAKNIAALYTAQPKKEWVGLTDDEIHKIEQECDQKFEDYFEFANAIEAKLKEKNT